MKKCPKNCGMFDDYVVKCPKCGARLVRSKAASNSNGTNNSGADNSSARNNGTTNGGSSGNSSSTSNNSTRNNSGNNSYSYRGNSTRTGGTTNNTYQRSSYNTRGYDFGGWGPTGNTNYYFKFDRSVYVDPSTIVQNNNFFSGANAGGNSWSNGSSNATNNQWNNQNANQANNAPTPYVTDFQKNGVRGKVKNMREGTMHMSAFEKASSVLLYRMNPLKLSEYATSFQLIEIDDADAQTGNIYEITMRGQIRTGHFYDGNIVKVWGKRANTGEVYARDVYNESTCCKVKVQLEGIKIPEGFKSGAFHRF